MAAPPPGLQPGLASTDKPIVTVHTSDARRSWAGCLGLAAGLLASACAAAQPLADDVLAEVNRYRASKGLGLLQPDARLQAIATEHSAVLACQGRLSHDGFQQRLQRSGAQLCVENLAAGSADAVALVAAWRASPEHHRNLLEPGVHAVGMGQAGPVISLLACRFEGP